MTVNLQKIEYKNFLIATLSLYILASIPLLIFFRHQLNPDGISYISIAHKYASGDFGSAINGLWSPMYSWLLVPFLALGVDAQLSAKLLNLLFGLLTIIAIYGLTRKLELGKLSTNLVLVCTAAVALSFANRVITPDLLSVLLLLIYFNVIFDKDYSAGIKQGVICGILGAFAYFSKGYMLTFFIGHFVLMNILRWFLCKYTDEKKRLFINMLCGIFVFMALCSPWILLLSSKYEKFTITNAGAFNMALVSPGFDERLQYTDGFIPPANSSATSFMEDP
ncbi:MAG: glycosyltransferase family 39 protein, partial [candidate division Zixibacteria bacterium]|nr:glycosyltransferase family 39 protein [candidate division Zixibacteria bacterium]